MLQEKETNSFPPGLGLGGNGGGTRKPVFGKRSALELAIDVAIFIVMTAYLIPMLIITSQQPTHVDGVEFAVVIYCFISLRLLARHVSVSQLVYEPIGRFASLISRNSGLEGKPKLATYGIGATVLACLLLTAIFSAQSANSSIGSRLQSCLGIVLILGFAYATSKDRYTTTTVSTNPTHTHKYTSIPF